MSRSHTASRPLSAMQLTNTTLMLFSSSSAREVASIEFTKAVLPQPGEPEMYKTGSVALESGLELINVAMKLVMSCRSGRRPAISAELLQVARSSARERICNGTEEDGVRGGVCNPKFVVNIVVRFEVEALRRKAIQELRPENIEKEQNRNNILICECVGVMTSVLDRLRPRGDSLRVSGGIFSLFPLRSVSSRDVRGRLAHGPESIVDASSSSSRRSTEADLMLAGEGKASS